MVWVGISFNGRTELRFLKPGTKINSQYYIDIVLKPFFEQDLLRLYPQNNAIFDQDSAPSHTSKMTLNFLGSTGINFIDPSLQTPKSPDNAPLDFCIWSYMENRLKKRNIRTIIGLKTALKQIWNEIPQQIIDNCSNSWPKRCLLIHKAKEDNIEHLLKQKKTSHPSNQEAKSLAKLLQGGLHHLLCLIWKTRVLRIFR